MGKKITKIEALSLADKLMQYINGLDYSQISQTERNLLWRDIDKIRMKIQLIRE